MEDVAASGLDTHFECKAAFLGETDVGKITLCRLLTNKASGSSNDTPGSTRAVPTLYNFMKFLHDGVGLDIVGGGDSDGVSMIIHDFSQFASTSSKTLRDGVRELIREISTVVIVYDKGRRDSFKAVTDMWLPLVHLAPPATHQVMILVATD
jgi:hypothetical protein